MICYQDIRQMLLDWPKHDGCRHMLRAPLINRGFPGTFNLSSTEHMWLAEFDSYVDWDHDFVFSTVQSCVRLNDFDQINDSEGWRYLGVFELADLSGEISFEKQPDYFDAMNWQFAELVRFFRELDVPLDRIHVSYCAGGKVERITAGKYRFDFDIPPDAPSRDALLACGLPETNLIADHTRETLLSLYLHRPTPWGYRNEIFVNIGTKSEPQLLDVATSEYLVWNPVYQRDSASHKNICGLAEWESGYFGIAFGVERLCMALNGLHRVHDVDYLSPFYSEMTRLVGRDLSGQDYRVGESLRVLHRVYTDREFHKHASLRMDKNGNPTMGRWRQKKAAQLKRGIPTCFASADLKQLLELHASTQPWHPHLAACIDTTIGEIDAYRCSKARHLVPRG